MFRLLLSISVVVSLLFAPAGVSAQTQEYLDAPVIKSRIRVRWNPGIKKMEWLADDETGSVYRTIEADALFLTKKSIFISYDRFNPLRLQASVSVTAADDPAHATIAKLIEAITTVVTTVSPTALTRAAGGLAACGTAGSAETNINELQALLYGPTTDPKTVAALVKGWIKKIDDAFSEGKNGPQAVQTAIDSIVLNGNALQDNIKLATEVFAMIRKCAADKAAPDYLQYLVASLTKATVDMRIQQLTDLKAAFDQLVKTLKDGYADATKWTGKDLTEFRIGDEIKPTFAKQQNVTVKVVNIVPKVDPASSVLTTTQENAGSATLIVRRYASFVPEIGVGAVFGNIKQPKYGTATNDAGETIVARVEDDSISINPSILVNFVCRCSAGPLAPMFQLGAVTSKDLPGVLGGFGLRLFGAGKGDIAIGAGAMAGWVKDLQKLKAGDVVSGTKDIEKDLGYSSRPKGGWYFVIQYKF